MGDCLSSPEKDGNNGGSGNAPKSQERPSAVPIDEKIQKEAAKNFGLQDYVVIRPLGVGGTGETFLCKRKDTGEEEAVKIIKRPIPTALKTLITNEITLQASIGEGHLNIVHAHSVILTKTHLCLFMDFISGGTLTDYVSDRADTIEQRNGLFLDEDEARFLFKQCINAVDYCHDRNVAHRDLKLDNTLLSHHDPPQIKICDFGFAKLMQGSNLTTNIGTPVYMAPQQITKTKKGYDGRASDVWACGVLLFVMLLGAFPFEHSPGSAADEQRAFNEVHFEQIRIHWTENPRNKDIVKHMSPECVDLLDRIFQLNESKRIKISEIRQHPWFTAPMSPKYTAAMQAIDEEQEGLLKLMDKFKDGAITTQSEVIKNIVACACETGEPSAQAQSLLGQQITLLRLRNQHALEPMPEET